MPLSEYRTEALFQANPMFRKQEFNRVILPPAETPVEHHRMQFNNETQTDCLSLNQVQLHVISLLFLPEPNFRIL